jgi:outer membrane protein
MRDRAVRAGRRPRREAVGVALALLAFAGAARADDLLDIYRLARARDPVLASADAARAVTHDLSDQARAALLPQASAVATLGRERDSGAAQATVAGRTTDTTLSVTQVVFDAGLASSLQAARATADAQDATYRAAQQALCLRVATAYFDALLAADEVTTVQANEDAYAQQVAQARQRYAAGLDAQVDVDQSRVYQLLAHNSTLAARQALVDAQGVIAEITGSAPGALKTLRDDLPLNPPAPADSQAWVAQALLANPTVQAARLSVDAAGSAISGARAAHLPSLSAGVGLGRPTGTTYDSSSGRLTTTVGLTLTVPLFAGGATQARVSQAVHQREGAQDTLESSRRAVVRSAQEAFGSLVSGIGQVESGRASVAAAQKSLDATRVGHEVGTRTTSDLLLAIQMLASAQDAYAQARHQLILGRLQLQQAAGALTEADLAAVNALLQ